MLQYIEVLQSNEGYHRIATLQYIALFTWALFKQGLLEGSIIILSYYYIESRVELVMEFEISARMNFCHNLERRKTDCVYL